MTIGITLGIFSAVFGLLLVVAGAHKGIFSLTRTFRPGRQNPKLIVVGVLTIVFGFASLLKFDDYFGPHQVVDLSPVEKYLAERQQADEQRRREQAGPRTE